MEYAREDGMSIRVIRRVAIHCPHGGTTVEVDLEMSRTGRPERVLRCSARAECPPTCDGACRYGAECVTGPARAILVCPSGTDVPEEID
jgi:hypothetical protein